MQIVYGLTIVGIELAWLSLVSTVVSRSFIRRKFLAISHWVERVTGAVLIALGLRLALASQQD